ncbi:unnamed protein product, partial [marine sediment metagenome]
MKCSNCGYEFDDHACITSKKTELQNGDISICFNCGEVHQFMDGTLKLIDIKYLPLKTQKEIKIAISTLN